jgi:hypothetical protein
MAAAASATSPNRRWRPLGRWVMVLFSAWHSHAGTAQRAAAAAISISRAVAPAWRRVCCEALTERLALVDMSPQTRCRLRFSAGAANSGFTRRQSHSSSSATSMGSAVKMPWPISERATRMTTVSSGQITIQALTSGAASPARAGSPPSGSSKPSTKPPPMAAALARKERRLNRSAEVMLRGLRARLCGTGPACTSLPRECHPQSRQVWLMQPLSRTVVGL